VVKRRICMHACMRDTSMALESCAMGSCECERLYVICRLYVSGRVSVREAV